MNKERLTTFIDAVLAIIMTILVLELEKPNPVSFAGFWALKSNFFAYKLSFFWLGTMWVNLHNGWYKIKRIDGYTIWAALVMFFFSSLFPYATSIVARNFNNTAAQVFYGIIVILITIFNYITYQTVSKVNQDNDYIQEQITARNKWFMKDILIKIVGLIIVLFIYPPAMTYAILATLLFLVIPNQIKVLRKSSSKMKS